LHISKKFKTLALFLIGMKFLHLFSGKGKKEERKESIKEIAKACMRLPQESKA